jgi:hypothetical protein
MAEMMDWLAGLPPAMVLRENATLYLLVNAAHIIGIGLLVGAILPLDLVLLGVVRGSPVPVLASFLSRCAATGLAVAVVTGIALFSVKPGSYATNPAFLAKLGLIGLGLANVLALHRSQGWKQAIAGGTITAKTKFLSAMSFVLWVGAVVAGRWIGFL